MGQQSCPVAMRRQSFTRPNMISILAVLVAVLVVPRGFSAGYPARDEELHPFVFQACAKTVSALFPVGNESVDRRRRAAQCPYTDLIAHLTGGDQEPDRTSFAVCHGIPSLVRPIRRPRPLFDLQAGRCALGLKTDRVDHHRRLLFRYLGGQTCKDPCEHALFAPVPPAVVQGLVRALPGRCITPTQPIAINEDHSRQKTPAIDSRPTVGLRKVGPGSAVCASVSKKGFLSECHRLILDH